ncbi:MAG: cytochrome c oxidase subunit II, partial [Cyanobacteria bacterium J06558_2]
MSAVTVVLAAISYGMGQLSYSWFPPQASAEAILYDDLFSLLTIIATFVLLGVILAILYNVVLYQAGRYD